MADLSSADQISRLVLSPSHLTREHFCMGSSSVCFFFFVFLFFCPGDKSDCVLQKAEWRSVCVCRPAHPAKEFSQTARIVLECGRGRE